MKVTRQGVDPDTIVHKAKCYRCSTEYEFLRTDPELTLIPSRDPKDQGCLDVRFKCHTCPQDVLATIPG